MGKSLEIVAIELIELAYDLLSQSSLDFCDSLEMLRDMDNRRILARITVLKTQLQNCQELLEKATEIIKALYDGTWNEEIQDKGQALFEEIKR